MFHPAESSEQQVDTYEMLVKSPTYNIEDKIQERFDKEFYKDVRYPSTLQSRAPSVASSVFPTERANPTSAVTAHARRRLDPRFVLQLSTTAAQVRMEVSCVSAQDPAAPRPPPG